jgi:hypothetical protein
LPAPDGPITATCSPAAIDSDSGRSAGSASRAAAGWRATSASSRIAVPVAMLAIVALGAEIAVVIAAAVARSRVSPPVCLPT